IALYTSSNYNKIIENSITTLERRAYGIYSYRSYLNEFTSNNIETSGYRGDGIYLQRSYDNYLIGNQINTSGDGYGIFLFQDSLRNELKNNTINAMANNGIGIYLLQSSDNNEFIGNKINTVGINGYGLVIDDSNNTLIINSSITTQGSNAPGILLDGYIATIQDSIISTDPSGSSFDFIITNHGNITAINCTFETIRVTDNGGGILRVNNYLGVQVYDLDGATPLSGIDLEVVDNGNIIYSTPGFGGMMPATDSNGRIDKIIVPDRWFDHDNNATENITDIKVKKLVGLDWEEARADVNMGTSHTEVFIAYENTPPATPTGLRVSRVPGENTLNITWDHNFNTFNYTIYTKKTGDWYALTNITHPQNWCLDSDLTDEIEHYYKIQAWSRFGLYSALSMPVSYYLNDITPPIVPIGLSVQPVPLGDALNISWNSSFDDTEKYEIWWKRSLKISTWEQASNISHPMTYFI
ncbi:MAG: right-handed parallel beta-helix repeat-containing protein, partial [Thermoplasmata archaeon]|nr:right-handed parallel beta-helix repeat-containing protein [Thermoplasmata archaeon]